MPASPDWTTLDAAFDRALDLEGEAREAYLGSLGAETREALAPLLRAADAEHAVLDRREAVLAPLVALTDGPPPVEGGARVGPYRLGDLVGEGGMGRVYRAHRADGAFDKTVAVKVVRQSLTLAGSDVAARLRRERDLLAALDHPGIARLLDGGETADGVPYLVTEFVDGAPITDYADAHGLGVPDRVRLVAEVARAVDHAHRRFVVHRDLKPSNVLVTEADGRVRPVVLDFGIAKLLDETEDGGSAAFPLTQTGMRLLTPAYAAPELYEPTATITTAADVYGLGALLYETLTGHRPHDDARPLAGPPTTEPTRPSKVVTGRAADQARVSFDPARRSRQLRGDLDVICLRALHPDPARRYVGAAELADDLDRYLGGRPVEARPDSWTYIAGRFMRRHVGTVSTAAATLILGLSLAVFAFGRERAARAEAERAAAQAAEAADLLAGLFTAADPEPTAGRAVTAREALDAGVARVLAVESPPLRAYLLRILGETYSQLADPTRADTLLARALDIHGEASDAEASRARLAYASTRDAMGDPAASLELGNRVVRDAPDLAWRAYSVVSRAEAKLGRPREAVQSARRAVALAGPEAPPERRTRTLLQLGTTLLAVGEAAQARPVLREAYRHALESHGPQSLWSSYTRSALAEALVETGAPAEAEALLRISREYQARVFGDDTVGYVLASIARARSAAGDDRGAAALLDSAIVMVEPQLPPNHEDVAEWRRLRAAALAAARGRAE